MKKFAISFAFVFSFSSVSFAEVEATKVERKAFKPWSASYLSEYSGPNLDLDGDSGFNQFLSLGYGLENGYKFSAVVNFKSDLIQGGDNNHGQGDHQVRITTPNLYKDEQMTVTPQIRMILPTSNTSRNLKTIGKINPRLSVAKEVGDFSLGYIFSPVFSAYNKKTQDKQNVFTNGHIFSGSYKITDWLAYELVAYPAWTYAVGTTKADYNGTELETTFNFTVNDHVNFGAGVASSARDMDVSHTSFAGQISVKFL